MDTCYQRWQTSLRLAPATNSDARCSSRHPFTEAERIARNITVSHLKVAALTPVVDARTGLAEVERLASAGPRGLMRDVRATAGQDPAEAQRIARTITDRLVYDRTEASLWAIPHSNMREWALVVVVQVVAASDPVEAERIARAITSRDLRAAALAVVGRAILESPSSSSGR
jgi:hypothetical protein